MDDDHPYLRIQEVILEDALHAKSVDGLIGRRPNSLLENLPLSHSQAFHWRLKSSQSPALHT